MSTTPKASQPLIVVVSGGGPVGLTFSLNLTMMMGEKVKIIIYEGRWHVDEQGKTCWNDERQGKTRRDQVVTLQDHVINEMPQYIQDGLFKVINERVWPTSRNIPIREVEDRLLDLIQPFVENGQIKLIPENLNAETDCIIKGDFDILIGADGANSFVRDKYCKIPIASEGAEFACGVAYRIPDVVPSFDEPLHQALNCILTVSQTRYLVNSSASRRGYLNIRLIKEEFDELETRTQDFQSRNEPLDLLNYDKCPNSPVWTIIRQGLEFFKISSKYVFRVVPIKINVRHASVAGRELRFEINKNNQQPTDLEERKYKTALAFLVGDAVMNVHFWPGRGMNSGMKGAMALARNIVSACTINGSNEIRTSLRFLDFLDYEGFIARLRAREQQGRSLRILIDPIDQYIEASYSYTYTNHCYITYKNKLVEKLKGTAARLQNLPDWPHKSREITKEKEEEELKSASNRISKESVAQLSLANPWPTREMSGAEVLVEATFPYDPTSFLRPPTVPTVPMSSLTVRERPPTVIIRDHQLILWIADDEKIGSIRKLEGNIRKSQNLANTSTTTDSIHPPTVAHTAEEAEGCIISMEALINQPNTKFKVVILWPLKNGQAAFDIIRAVRSAAPYAPILVFTNELEQARPAREFRNTLTTDVESELKEFVGINQGTQWDEGCEVSSQLESNPLLLWIDSVDNDVETIKRIREDYPKLEINFISTYKDTEEYLRQNLREIDDRNKVIVVTRGYYSLEKKSFTDIVKLFVDYDRGAIPFAVYTRSKTRLSAHVSHLPQGVKVFEKRKELLDFVKGHLQQQL